MEKISDAAKLQGVIDALGISANRLATELEYESAQSVYHVLNEANKLSKGMKDRILKKYPNVNADYLSDRARLPILLTGPDLQTQMNLFNIPSSEGQDFLKFKRLMEIPERMDTLERMFKQILEKLDKSSD